MEGHNFKSEFNERYGLACRKIIRMLSENSRCSISEMADALNISRRSAAGKISILERELGMNYTVELDENLIGLQMRHLLVIKLDKKPDVEKIRMLFRNDSHVVHAFLCEGDFDIIIHALAPNPMDYVMWESLLPGKLSDYGVDLFPRNLMLTNFGYMPIDGASVLHMARGMDNLDRRILALLIDDSRLGLRAMASKLGINATTLKYRMDSLLQRGIIKRFTVSFNRPPKNYLLAYVTNYHFNKTSHLRSMKMMDYYKRYDNGLPLLNTFQLLAPMSGSFRFLGIALFDDKKSADKSLHAHCEIFNQENVNMKRARIADVIKGTFPFRNLDMDRNYTKFRWQGEL